MVQMFKSVCCEVGVMTNVTGNGSVFLRSVSLQRDKISAWVNSVF